MAARHKARLWALQILYRIEFNNEPTATVFDDFRDGHDVDEQAFRFTIELVEGVTANLASLDRIIEAAADHWRIRRMAATDRNILRLGAYELLHCRDVPPAVTIDQAIRLAKKFGSDDSGKFVNGILDRIHHNHKD